MFSKKDEKKEDKKVEDKKIDAKEVKSEHKEGDKIVNTKDLKDLPSTDPKLEEQKKLDAQAEKKADENLAKDLKVGEKLEEEYKAHGVKVSKKQDKRALSDIAKDSGPKEDINDSDLVEEFKPGRKYRKGDQIIHNNQKFEAVVDHEGNVAPNMWKPA